MGYSEIAIETFWETFVEELEGIETQGKTVAHLQAEFREEHGSQASLVWYCRLLTSGYLKENADRFLPFLGDLECDMASFCAREVEPMGKECEQVQIMALCEQLGVPLAIEYLDGEDFGERLNQVHNSESFLSHICSDAVLSLISFLFCPVSWVYRTRLC
ncbi:unnamed protein product [Phaeothamnion confervicola]